jgi:hypothetical protein
MCCSDAHWTQLKQDIDTHEQVFTFDDVAGYHAKGVWSRTFGNYPAVALWRSPRQRESYALVVCTTCFGAPGRDVEDHPLCGRHGVLQVLHTQSEAETAMHLLFSEYRCSRLLR